MVKKTCNAADIANETIEELLPTKKCKQNKKGKRQNKKTRTKPETPTLSSNNSAAAPTPVPVLIDSTATATLEISIFQEYSDPCCSYSYRTKQEQ